MAQTQRVTICVGAWCPTRLGALCATPTTTSILLALFPMLLPHVPRHNHYQVCRSLVPGQLLYVRCAEAKPCMHTLEPQHIRAACLHTCACLPAHMYVLACSRV
jgi:hypothetical protein